ncbi:superantigen-like protein SSL4 [Mastigocladopsis repens]|uniref:hypothetical protein n=1 Tax=Mastigocladopsis repens TaxID=221287 RepID=UPI0002F0C6C3|nr:hypothetical protein [Mastigocladopsis repens]
MSQNPLVDSVAKYSKTTGLKPPLAAALASLEVQLDQELARYRRTRTGYRTFSQPRVGTSTSSKPQQLTDTSTTGGRSHSPIEDTLASSSQKFGLATAKASTPSVLGQEELLVTPETKINPPKSVVETPDQVSASVTVPDTLLQPQTSQRTFTPDSSKTQHPQPDQDSILSNSAEVQTTPTPSTSIVPTGVKEQSQSKSENLTESEDNTGKQPNDYLESSEALLRSLAQEEPKTDKSTSSNDSLLSPLGIGSMLLLLLASLTLGYVVFNPKSLSQFSLDRLFKKDAPTTAENTAQDGNNVKTVAQPNLTPIPKYPNLATDEFPEVRDPNDVVGLKPKPKPNPLTDQNPTNPITIPNVQPPVGLNSAPPSTAKTPQKRSDTQQTPEPQIKPSADGFYHVITDNQGERSFASARRVVADAYLSPDGKLIYLGALKTKEKAQKLLEQIQAEGIKARIEKP